MLKIVQQWKILSILYFQWCPEVKQTFVLSGLGMAQPSLRDGTLRIQKFFSSHVQLFSIFILIVRTIAFSVFLQFFLKMF